MNAPKDEDRLLDHDYDGITEYDNPLPRWWLWILWVSIIWSALYWFNVPGVGIGKGRIADYEADMAAATARFPPRLTAGPRTSRSSRRPPTRGAATRQGHLHGDVRRLPRAGRRRRDRAESHRRLLASRQQSDRSPHTVANGVLARACRPGEDPPAAELDAVVAYVSLTGPGRRLPRHRKVSKNRWLSRPDRNEGALAVPRLPCPPRPSWRPVHAERGRLAPLARPSSPPAPSGGGGAWSPTG
jgi:hypothetical protein